jgi:hypothetical protein
LGFVEFVLIVGYYHKRWRHSDCNQNEESAE